MPNVCKFLLFDVAQSVAFMETAGSVVTILGHANVVAANCASAQETVLEPIPEIGGVSLTYDSGVKWRVDINFDFVLVRNLQVVNLVECCLVFLRSWCKVWHVRSGSSYGNKIVVDD